MLITDLARISLRRVFRNRRRYKNAILLIFFGTSGIIAVLATGDAVLRKTTGDLELLAAATVLKATWNDRSTENHDGSYTLRDLASLASLNGVRIVSPIVRREQVTVSYKDKNILSTILGVEPSFFNVFDLRLGLGSRFTEGHTAGPEQVAILGQCIVSELFLQSAQALGEMVLIEGMSLRVVGILGGVEQRDFVGTVIVPFQVARNEILGMQKIREVYFRASNWGTVPSVRDAALRTLRANQPHLAEFIRVVYFPKRIEKIEHSIYLINFFLYAGLGVALMLAGLGINNTMLASVQERTVEIGLLKATGATEANILWQFLVESMLISLTGAMAGVVAGLVLMKVVVVSFKIFPDNEALILGMVGSALFASLLGILSGIVPARKASKLDAVESMRFE